MGARIGRYELLGELGRGGMGAVYRARDAATGRDVALKTLLHVGDPTALARFRREAQTLARLDHPGVVKVHDAGEAGGWPFLVCELVAGARPLDVAAGGLELTARVALVRDACRALGHAHARGVVHRDVKAPNILVDASGRVRVTDFGLAVLGDAERLTRTGMLVGTPSTMAPEQLDSGGAAITAATDVWALGVVLYQVLTGRLPFEQESLAELCGAILSSDPTPPRRLNAEVTRPLEAVCLRALSRRPDDRWADADAMADALDAALRGERVAGPRRRRPWRAVGAAAAALLVVGAVALGRGAWRSADLRVEGAPATPGAPGARVTGALRAAHGDRSHTRLGWLTVELELGGEPSAARLTVGGHLVVEPTGATWSGRVPLALGRNVVRLEAQRAGDARWQVVAQLAVERDGRFEPPPPAEVVDRRGRPVVLDEASETYTAADGSVLLYVPPTRFVRGSEECLHAVTVGAGAGEQTVRVSAPVHEVTITRGFLVGRDEVSWGQVERWSAEAGVTTTKRPPGWTPDHPASDLSWHEARRYCEWAGLELPTEAQWELAARGADRRRFPWGDEPPTPDRAVVRLADHVPRSPAPVSEALARGESWVGARHMAGNVWEWTLDQFIATYDQQLMQARHVVDPCYLPVPIDEAPPHAERVIRGGSWRDGPELAHAAYRTYASGELRYQSGRRVRRLDMGLRVVLALPPP